MGPTVAAKKSRAAPSNPTTASGQVGTVRPPVAAKTMTPASKTLNKNQTKQVLQEKNTKLEDENSHLRGVENFLTSAIGILNNEHIF